MAVGWARDGAVQEQIDASVMDAVKRARNELPKGESAPRCAQCEERIPKARQTAIPGVRFCVHCQTQMESKQHGIAGYNRRGSKDSQLK